MKCLSLILSLYVLILSVFPCCQQGQDIDKIELTIVAKADGANCIEATHEGDFCSPFVRCSCCTGFTLLSENNALLSPLNQDQILRSFYSATFFDISLPIWQPPKLC